jgi:hypothetical protein
LEKLKIVEMIFAAVYTLISAVLSIIKFIKQVEKVKAAKA